MIIRRAELNDSDEWLRMRTALWPDCSEGKHRTEMASDCSIDNEVNLAVHLLLGYEEVERLIHFRKTLNK